jgi:hypothetical protein
MGSYLGSLGGHDLEFIPSGFRVNGSTEDDPRQVPEDDLCRGSDDVAVLKVASTDLATLVRDGQVQVRALGRQSANERHDLVVAFETTGLVSPGHTKPHFAQAADARNNDARPELLLLRQEF